MKINTRQGISLVEVMVTTLLSVSILAGIYATFIVGERAWRYYVDSIMIRQQIRMAMLVLTNELREARGALIVKEEAPPGVRLNFLKPSAGQISYLWNGSGEDANKLVRQDSSGTRVIADNISSVSTIYSGVGLRITGRDKFKCTAYYQNPSTRFCDNMLQKKADEFDILFADDGSLDHSPDPTKLAEVCKIECAVNYYPDKPFNATDEESHARDKNNLERSKMPWGNLMPDSDNILYLEVPNYAKAAASYKMIETVYQILDIDKNGCYSNETMKKLGRDISCDADGKNCSAKMPFTIVLPNWVANEIKNKNTPAEVSGTSTSIWKDLEKTAKANYLIDLQSVNRSPLAGISWDPDKVDSQGNLINWNSTLENLHVNY